MDLYEHQGKELFARHGIPLVDGSVAESAEQTRRIAERLGGKVAVKVQVHIGALLRGDLARPERRRIPCDRLLGGRHGHRGGGARTARGVAPGSYRSSRWAACLSGALRGGTPSRGGAGGGGRGAGKDARGPRGK